MKNCRTPPFPKHSQSRDTSDRIKLLLVDDHRALLDLLEFYLGDTAGFVVVATATNGWSAVTEARRTRHDVVIMDVNLPELTGIQAARLLLKVHPCAAVIGLSAYSDHETAAAMIRAGAKGFVPKSAAFEELIQAVKTVSQGGMYLSAKISQFVRPTHQSKRKQIVPSLGMLTEQERRVLAHLADGLSNKEIAGELRVAVRTVEKHREMLIEKLHISGVARLTKFAICHSLTSLD